MNTPSIRFALLGFLLFSVTSFAKTQVAAVFADSDLCKTKVCLHGKYKKGEALVLLSKDGTQTCMGKVGKSFKAIYKPGNFEASEVNSIKKCKIPPKQIFLAVFNRPKVDFKIYPIEEMTGEALKETDVALKKNRVFSKAWRREVFHKSGDGEQVVYAVEDYKKLEPQGFLAKLPPGNKNELQLIKHRFTDGANDGIYFSFFKKEWSAVSSSFTVGQPFVFTINGRVFISNTVTCQMSCGYQDTEIYEFNGRVFKLIYNNADFST